MSKKYLIVGMPCQIQGVKLYTNLYKSLQILTLGIACSGAISYKLTEKTIAHYGYERSLAQMFYYRGNGWPGFNELVLKDGRRFAQNHIKSYFNVLFSSKVFTNFACKDCRDHISEMADISFFDFWNKEELEEESEGKTGVLIRTTKGMEYFNETLKLELISKGKSLTKEAIIECQGTAIRAKKFPRHPFVLKFYIKICQIIFVSKVYKYMPLVLFKILIRWYHSLV